MAEASPPAPVDRWWTSRRCAGVLDSFNDTVGRVDETGDRVGVITTELAEVVNETGRITVTFSPAFALNDQFRRQLEKLRSLAGNDDSGPPPER